MLNALEHIELMQMFEKEYRGHRLDKEPRGMWAKGIIYQDGRTNELFLSYRRGYAFGKVIGRNEP